MEITDNILEKICTLANLELKKEEREAVREELTLMVQYIDRMRKLDDCEVIPLTHPAPVQNVFREDVITGEDVSAQLLACAPEACEEGIVVPKTVSSGQEEG